MTDVQEHSSTSKESIFKPGKAALLLARVGGWGEDRDETIYILLCLGHMHLDSEHLRKLGTEK